MDQMKAFKRSRKIRDKLLYLTFIEMMCENELISSRTFQNDFFDDLNALLDDNGTQKLQANGKGINMVHLKILRDIMVPYGIKLIFLDTSLLDKFMLSVKLLRSRCEQKLDFGNSQVKTGSVIKLVLDEVKEFLMNFSTSKFKEDCQ